MSPERERKLIVVLAVVQFVNILDFMMVMPLGPDFACDLGIPLSHLGYIGGSYTAAAALSGFGCAFFLDRFDRRPALALSLLGLAVGTFAGSLSTGLGSLIGARLLAGAFGGPATAVAMSILADVIPPERRGRALGSVMMAFALASVLGVPAGLQLAHIGGWHLPFVVVGGLGLFAAILAYALVPSLTGHLGRKQTESVLASFARLLTRPTTQLSYLGTAISNFGLFVLIPNLAAFTQGNLGYPRHQLWLLYLLGGVASVLTTRPFGRLVDRYGSFKVTLAGTVLTILVILIGFIFVIRSVPVEVIFVGFMLANGLRNVSVQTLSTKVPSVDERARFMSLQSMTQHLFCALGAFASSQILGTSGEGSGPVRCGETDTGPVPALVGMEWVAWIAIVSMVILPWIVREVERRVTSVPKPPSAPLPA
jgi:predicted MFS family arabinose efflux permease